MTEDLTSRAARLIDPDIWLDRDMCLAEGIDVDGPAYSGRKRIDDSIAKAQQVAGLLKLELVEAAYVEGYSLATQRSSGFYDYLVQDWESSKAKAAADALPAVLLARDAILREHVVDAINDCELSCNIWCNNAWWGPYPTDARDFLRTLDGRFGALRDDLALPPLPAWDGEAQRVPGEPIPLPEQFDILMAAVNFYADPDNWALGIFPDGDPGDAVHMICVDQQVEDGGASQLADCGVRARVAQSKVKNVP